MTIWIDVEDLFHYALSNPRPSGIQRLAFEIYAVLQARGGAGIGVRFVRHNRDHTSFEVIGWDQVTALFTELTHSDVATAKPSRRYFRDWYKRTLDPTRVSDFVNRLPPQAGIPLRRFLVLQRGALRALRDLATAGRPARTAPLVPAPITDPVPSMTAGPVATEAAFQDLARPGDILLVLGAPWFDSDYATLIAAARKAQGVRVALLIYDLIPIRRPEWCHHTLVQRFETWFASTLPQCDMLFAISHASAADVELYARQKNLPLPGPVRTVPIGSGFKSLAAPQPENARPASKLPAPGSYVLFVSTIEARKNHVLLFRVWRELIDTMPEDAVPTLVFAGRVGWLVADLMRQLENTAYLNGKVLIVNDPTDADLLRLYQGCLFTVFPSLFEGWGLPVTESLALGKPCVISNKTSLPEAGGDLARYFDPDEFAEVYRVIRETIEDRAGLAAWEARVATEFRPVSWEETADAILAGVLPARTRTDRHSASVVS
jgi:glycosyltransferase involved in cell wall biosynthesis